MADAAGLADDEVGGCQAGFELRGALLLATVVVREVGAGDLDRAPVRRHAAGAAAATQHRRVAQRGQASALFVARRRERLGLNARRLRDLRRKRVGAIGLVRGAPLRALEFALELCAAALQRAQFVARVGARRGGRFSPCQNFLQRCDHAVFLDALGPQPH